MGTEAALAAGERQRTLVERYSRRIRQERLECRVLVALGGIAALVALGAFCGVFQ